GARFSLDCRLGRRAARATVPALPVRCLQVQIAIIYLITCIAKSGATWRGGTAVLLVLQNPQWSRGLGPLIARAPALCRALARATLLIEGAFPLLVFSPWRPRACRAAAIALGTALHLGIFCTIRVGLFSLVMPVSYLVFLAPEWIDRAERRLRGRGPAREAPRAASPPAPRWAALRRRAGLALLTLTFL